MNNDLGGDSRDLRALGIPEPAEMHLQTRDRETRIRRTDRWALISGVTIIVGALLGSTGLAVATDGPTFHNPIAQMYGILTLVTLVAAGAILIAIGATGRRQRLERAMMRELMRKTQGNVERLDVVMGIVAAIPGRLDAVEQALDDVPNYGKGVIEGVQMRQEALHPHRD